ncbi:hypothetical protein IWX90DRAFT_412103 [Phyllosticta citrichinensis]|uniref:DUF7730 domain-containing protein n=1 Tax=Phyllosticta citrichinensis TaxID=1130410 RepID=A0ABR1Y3F5_9PEZI
MDDASKRKKLEFLDLPGEIRNMIYNECFPPDKALEVDFSPSTSGLHPKQEVNPFLKKTISKIYQDFDIRLPAERKDRSNPHRINVQENPPSRSSRKEREMESSRKRHLGASLLSTCRRTYWESRGFLYSRSIFMFSSSKRLLRFITIVSSESLALVRHVQITQAMCGIHIYSEPGFLRDRYENDWLSVMQVAASRLTGLRDLEVWLCVTYSPVHFDFSRAWAQSILAFGTTRPSIRSSDSIVHPEYDGCPSNVQLELWGYPLQRLTPSVCNDASIRLHVAFAEALRRRMMGWSDADALVDFKKAESQYLEILRL